MSPILHPQYFYNIARFTYMRIYPVSNVDKEKTMIFIAGSKQVGA